MESSTQNSVVSHLETLPEPVWGPMGKVVYERTYSRIKRDGEKESWAETVDRVTSTIEDVDERKRVAELIYSFKMIPAGRHLWVTGTGLPYNRNCFRAPFTDRLADHFEFMGSQLMTGGGVGANYSQEYLTLSPPVKKAGNIYITIDRSHRDYNDVKRQAEGAWLEPEDFLDRVNDLYYNHGAVALTRIADTREGWVEAWGLLFDHTAGPNSELDLFMDLTEVRPRGELIKTFGGTASGPDPLAGSLVKVYEVLRRAEDRHLSSVEAMECDHYLAEAIVAGGARRCLPGHVRINTARGSVRMDQVKVGDLVDTPKGRKRVTAVFDQGKQDLVVITHAMGEIECTPNHRVAVYDSLGSWTFKEAQHLTEEDHLVWDGIGALDGISELPGDVDYEFDTEFAWMIGLLQGDGHIGLRYDGKPSDGTPKVVKFAMSNEYPDMITRLITVLGRFGNPTVISGDGDCSVVALHGVAFAQWCFEHVKQSNNPLHVPSFIWAAPSEIRWAYAAGLFDSDGSCKTRPLNLISTVYHSLSSDLIRLMNSLGVAAYQKQTMRDDWQTLFSVAVRGTECYTRTSDHFEEYSTKFVRSERKSTGNGGSFGFSQKFTEQLGVSHYGGTGNVLIPVRELEHRGIGLGGAMPTKVVSVAPLPYQEYTYDIEVEDIHQFSADGLVVHNSARMSIVHWDDPHIFDFIHCKENPMLHWSTNISVEVDDLFFEALTRKDEGALAIAKAVVTGMVRNGEPGFYNSSYAAFGEHSDTRSTNPCFSADTLVMTADGRDAVSFEQLAREGKDVPVYSTDEFGNVSIKMGRNPRITGYNQKLLRIHTDKDFYVDVTPNHKMMTRDGQVVEAKDLQIGQSLMPFTKRQEKFSSDGQPYWRVCTNALTEKEGKVMEHRLVSQFNDPDGWGSTATRIEEGGGCADTGGIVVHHKDFNGLNNSPDNLDVMTWREHQLLHAQLADISGEKNPRYSGFTNDDIRNRAIELTKELGRRFSHKEWVNDTKVSTMPVSFSSYRSELGSIVELSHWAAKELGFDTKGIDTRTLRLLQSAEQQGYQAQLIDKAVFVNRECETCDHEFLINYQQREQAFCSVACSNKHLENDPKRKAAAAKHWSDKMAETKTAQAKIYCDLKYNLGRNPQKPEWVEACKVQEISYRLNPKSPNAFPNWKAVQEAGDNHNHKVVRIEELDGEHTVYNMTVDENHTLCVGKLIENRYTGLNVLQCGEINLQEGESCNIGSVNLAAFGTDDQGAREAFKMMARYLVRATLMTPDHNLTAMVESKNRRIGVGFFGFQEWAAAHGVKYSEIPSSELLAEKLESFRRTVRIAADQYADELGIPRPIKVTAIAPNGTISILPGVQAGIHPVLAKYFKRRVRFTNGDKLIDQAIAEGRHTEPCMYSQNTTVVENIVRDQILDDYDENIIQESDEVTLDEQLAVLQFVTHHFTNGTDGNAVSFTANIQPDELVDFDHVYEVIMSRLPYVKGMTIFPALTRPQSPIEAITAEEYRSYHGIVEEHGSSLDEDCSTGACPIR
jgi:ribonucleotide reductase alpha subunit